MCNVTYPDVIWYCTAVPRERFRVTPAIADEIERVVAPVLQHDSERNMALSPREQLLTTLRYVKKYLLLPDHK